MTPAQDLRFTILMGMRAGFRLIGLRRVAEEREQNVVADEIAKRIEAKVEWPVDTNPVSHVEPGFMAKLPDSKKPGE